MKLAQIKKTLGIEALDLQRQLDESGAKTEWLRSWDNLNRIAVVVHQDVLAKIKADPESNKIVMKSEKKLSKDTEKDGISTPGAEYVNHILIISENLEESL